MGTPSTWLTQPDTWRSTKYNILKWNHHINQITKKANSTPVFLWRNSHQCPQETKAFCFKTLDRSLTEFASVIWDPHKTSIS
jgi:hypothetical protein